MRISILFDIVVVITVMPRSIVNGPWSIIMSELLGVDVLEETTVLHGVIGLGMDLAGTLQSFVVVLLIVSTTNRLLDRVDLMVVLAGVLASITIVIIGPPITIISAVAIVVVTPVATVVVVVPTTVIGFLIPARWVLGHDDPPTSSLMIFSASSASA
jgi:hypothetical protein